MTIREDAGIGNPPPVFSCQMNSDVQLPFDPSDLIRQFLCWADSKVISDADAWDAVLTTLEHVWERSQKRPDDPVTFESRRLMNYAKGYAKRYHRRSRQVLDQSLAELRLDRGVRGPAGSTPISDALIAALP